MSLRARVVGIAVALGAALLGHAAGARAQASRVQRAQRVDGRALPQRSCGVEQGRAWALDENGYVGAYVRLAHPGPVTITVSASALADGGAAPEMNVVAADESRRFAVGPERRDYVATLRLPEGTTFVRVEYTNHVPRKNRELVVHALSVKGAGKGTGIGAELLLENTNENALAAADTYVRAYRRGPAKIRLAGARPGAQATVRLRRHAFNFGVNIPFATNRMIPVRVEPGSDAARYQKMVLDNFNTVVLSNGGKWVYHEPVRDKVDLAYVDRFLDFAEEHGLRARMHTMLWDTEQQPAWVVSEDRASPGLLTRATNGDEAARAELTGEIDERIDDYVRKRARRYIELDVINESVHRVRYWRVYGARGFADIFNKVARAVKDAGARTRLYLNEYDVMQSSTDPLGGGPDAYGNWYRRHVDEVLRAGGAVSGVGIQYYVDGRPAAEIGSRAHSPARMAQVLNNLSAIGLPLSLTEFSVNQGHAPPERAAVIVEETLRMVFGTPRADSFLIWAIWPRAASAPAPESVLFDEAGAPTPSGLRYQALMKAWTTDLTVPVGPDGSIQVVGFYGDYDVTVDGKTRPLSLVKGTTEYNLGQ